VGSADERAIAALRKAGRISPSDGALVANLRVAGRALDDLPASADPFATATLLRAHLGAAVALVRASQPAPVADELDALLRSFASSPMGDAAID
jgi:hypothetical protein